MVACSVGKEFQDHQRLLISAPAYLIKNPPELQEILGKLSAGQCTSPDCCRVLQRMSYHMMPSRAAVSA